MNLRTRYFDFRFLLAFCFSLFLFACCDCDCEQGPTGPEGPEGKKGDMGNSPTFIVPDDEEDIQTAISMLPADGEVFL